MQDDRSGDSIQKRCAVKISISFSPGEDDAAEAVVGVLKVLFPEARTKVPGNHPPNTQIYFTVKPEKDLKK